MTSLVLGRLHWPLLCFAWCLSGCDSADQKASIPVPGAAQQALTQKFGAPLEHLRWQPAGDRLCASFTWKTIPVQVWVTPTGHVQETRLTMLAEDVPQGLKDSLARYYSAYQRRAMFLVETPAGRFYRFELAPADKPARTFFFQADGRRLPPLKPITRSSS